MNRIDEIRRLSVTLEEEKQFEKLSPFELKNKLIDLAEESSRKAARTMLNAGRGNPNWIATTPRSAFFALGSFALQESKSVWDRPDLGGMPKRDGITKRFEQYATANPSPAVDFLQRAVKYATEKLALDADAFLYELVDGIIGDQYPGPDRMLVHAEKIVHEYLLQEMNGGTRPAGKFDLFAVEGGTAAMCYIFNSLVANQFVKRGDKVALATPTFSPYIEIPQLDQFGLRVVEVQASEVADENGRHTWQYPDAEIDKLVDPDIKVVFFVNPSNPPSTAIRQQTMDRLGDLVRSKRRDLLIVTDDVYATFVPGFRSLMAELPQNTIGVYSFSKYFGCTGWRLGVVAIHEDNVFDRRIGQLPAQDQAALNERYSSLALHPEKLKFIDRMVADSRCVALNHTAGLSTPQQVQMALFSLFALIDEAGAYKNLTQQIVRNRMQELWRGMGVDLPVDPLRADYYTTLDLMVWARRTHSPEFVQFLEKHYHPFDVLFALAERYSTVLLNGSGFEGPEWSVRVSLANLPDAAYAEIGSQLSAIVHGAFEAWQAQGKK
ncbi:MAG TPA: bifunctional aspartate transaminase/aspartate 4-decarboxylase [Terriglobales bacterium]|nr:bifunctional aspartate transaminase/aspartate 4-decarboxylase [Terriglobales bacterium]